MYTQEDGIEFTAEIWRADEYDPSTLTQSGRDHLDADRDALALTAHGFEHLAILVEHQVDDVVCSEFVDAEAERIDGLGGQRLPL